MFREQWLDDNEAQNSILRQLSGGSIDFQPSLSKLEIAIEMLLSQDFAAAALSGDGLDHSSAELRGIDADSLDASLRYFASYRSYLEQGIAKVPYEYRNALNSTAKSSTVATLWKLLSTLKPNSNSLSDNSTFNLPAQKASEVVTAFLALGRQDMSEKLLQELNRRAFFDLNRADIALQKITLYQPLHDNFDWWDGNKNAGLRAYRSSNPQDMQQYLASQLNQVDDLHNTVVPALEWLQANQKSLSAAQLTLLQRWQGLSVELQKYSEKNPSSAPALFERFANSLNAMELTNCNTTLAEVELPTGNDPFSSRAREVADLVSQRCAYLQEQTASAAWNQLSLYFSQYLAGRFPFSIDLQAADADPDRVRLFLQLLDENLTKARTGLTNSSSADAPAALDFLNHLQQARVWLDPLFQRDQDGIKGIDMDVRWRTDREAELGADQVIEWSLSSGSQQIRYPADDTHRLRWTLDQPVKLLLRWAKNATQKPADDPLQPALAVFEYEAGWEYQGPWALLRMLRGHVAFERIPTINYSETPLAFRLPVYAPYSVENHALMFVRIALMNPSGKSPLALTPLPFKAPISPFFSPSVPTYPWPDSFSSTKPYTP
jgi:type VI secretion system protein ImpL